MSKKSPDQKHIDELRKQIAKLTGRIPVSNDPRYLAQRLASLEKRKDSGEDVRRVVGRTVTSVSMPIAAGEAFDHIVQREKVSASALVLRALSAWARMNGYHNESQTFGAEA